MPNPDQPAILTQTMMVQALADPGFFQQVPEFTPFKAKLTAMRTSFDKPGGCGGCKRRRVQSNLYGDYLTLVQALSPDGLDRLKRYFKVQRFMLNTMDPRTHSIGIKII